jgi:hypothetical protein
MRVTERGDLRRGDVGTFLVYGACEVEFRLAAKWAAERRVPGETLGVLGPGESYTSAMRR